MLGGANLKRKDTPKSVYRDPADFKPNGASYGCFGVSQPGVYKMVGFG